MIIVFHSLYFVIKFALKWYRKQKALQAFRSSSGQRQLEDAEQKTKKQQAGDYDPEEHWVFATPVYRQRYSTVQDVLLDQRWRKDIKRVVDFGCAEFGFFQYVKHLLGITSILEVDIDEMLLKENRFRLQPLTADYLKQRTDPLMVEILSGSIDDPDWRLKSVDAVVAIEIIEHLFPDTLDALPYNIFGFAQPKLAIFTTPNSDFNVLFPNFHGFRHDDHKFEWSREQFEEWAHNIVTRFPNYSVTFSGIGKGPAGTESLGCCSQMAVFVKEYQIVTSEVPEEEQQRQPPPDTASFGVCTHLSYSIAHRALMAEDLLDLNKDDDDNAKHCDSTNNQYFKTIDVINYPYVEDLRTPEAKLLHEATYQILRHASDTSRYYNVGNGLVEIPLYELVKNFDGHFASEAEIRDLLVAANFKIAECALNGSGERCVCVQYDIDMDGNTSKAGSDDDDDGDSHGRHHQQQHDDHTTPQHCNINSSNDSDWEDIDEPSVKANKDEVATPSDPLVDSGYQKSLSNAEWSPQSPIEAHFDDHFVATKLDVNDIKDSIKARMALSRNGKQVNNRLLSEWRRFSGAAALFTTTAFSSVGPSRMKTSPTPGTSDPGKRRRKGHAKKTDSDEDSAKEDVRCIADVIMYNSLNRLDIDDDAAVQLPEAHEADVPLERPQDLELPQGVQFIVENGDLANNNRDYEGNNYPEIGLPAPGEVVILENGDDPNENNENREQLANHNQDQENRNVRIHPLIEYIDQERVVDLAEAAAAQAAPDQQHIADDDEDDEDENGLNHASREALFDPNSQVDMLDDMGSVTDENVECETETDTTDADGGELVEQIDVQFHEEPAIPDNNPFPNWLLQLFGGTYAAGAVGEEPPDDGNPDEAHFYCQGDGLGVHPSIVEVDVTSSSESSITDDAQAERTISEDDVGSLPTDALPTADVATLEVVGRTVELPIVLLNNGSNASVDSGGEPEEFFDTIDEQSSVPALNDPNTKK